MNWRCFKKWTSVLIGRLLASPWAYNMVHAHLLQKMCVRTVWMCMCIEHYEQRWYIARNAKSEANQQKCKMTTMRRKYKIRYVSYEREKKNNRKTEKLEKGPYTTTCFFLISLVSCKWSFRASNWMGTFSIWLWWDSYYCLFWSVYLPYEF